MDEQPLDYTSLAKVLNNLAYISNSQIAEINQKDYFVNNELFINQIPDIVHGNIV